MTESSKKNNKTLLKLNDKLLELMKNRGAIESFLMSPRSKFIDPDYISQITLVKDPQSKRIADLLINKTIPVTLYDNLLTFHDTDKMFEFHGHFLKKITIKN